MATKTSTTEQTQQQNQQQTQQPQQVQPVQESAPATTGWVPLNSQYDHNDPNGWHENYEQQMAAQQAAIAANPALGQAATQEQINYWWSQLTPEQQAVVSPGSKVANAAGSSGEDEDLLSQQYYAIVQANKNRYNDAQARYNEAVAVGDVAAANAAMAEMDAAHLANEQIRQSYGYSGGIDGSMYLTGWGQKDSVGTAAGYGGAGTSGGSGGNSMQDMLEQWRQAALEQNSGAIDYEVQRAVTALERALADAQPQFKEQIEGVARDELQGLDNSALYAEARGDKGGIGKSQYNEIQAQAAENRLTVQQAQAKLSTDTARQIEDLRSQGEFEKADAALEIAQTYLSQLISIEQWAAEMQLSREQFQQSIRQWEAEYQLAMRQFLTDQELSYAQMTGRFSDGTSTLAASQYQQEQLANMGYALLESGIQPSAEQLAAMGMTESQAQAYLSSMRKASSGASGEGNGTNAKISGVEDVYQLLQEQGYNVWSDGAQIKAFLTGLGITNAATYANGYLSWVKEQPITDASQLGESAREMFTIISDGIYPSSSHKKEIRRRLAREEITEAEADYLYSLLGG